MTYTPGEARVLDVLRERIRTNRRCDLSYVEIAKLAGVGKSTAQSAVMKAERRNDIRVQRRAEAGLSNVLRLP